MALQFYLPWHKNYMYRILIITNPPGPPGLGVTISSSQLEISTPLDFISWKLLKCQCQCSQLQFNGNNFATGPGTVTNFKLKFKLETVTLKAGTVT